MLGNVLLYLSLQLLRPDRLDEGLLPLFKLLLGNLLGLGGEWADCGREDAALG